MPGALLFQTVDWSAPDAMEQYRKQCDAERALSAATGTTAVQRARAAIDAGAVKALAAGVAALVSCWKVGPDYGILSFSSVCPAIVGRPSSPSHVFYMRAMADHVEGRSPRYLDRKTAAALRLWADEIEAEAQVAA